MDRSGNRLVVLVDGADVGYVFSSWPTEICLAVCLDPSGECRMAVFHRQERAGIAQTMLQRLGWSADGVSFVPKVDGFQTRQFLYSDERRLMALISCNADILEEAHDYAVNFTYALEEGLDPMALLGQDLGPDERSVDQDPWEEAPDDNHALTPLSELLRRPPPATKTATFASIRKAGLAALTG